MSNSNLPALYGKEDRHITLMDLDGDDRKIAVSCLQDEDSELCRWGRENIPAEDWERIQKTIANHKQLIEVCQRGDNEFPAAGLRPI